MSGKVYLVGAGPGDGGLMTLKGKTLLEKADVIVYDRLVGPEVMEMIPQDAELIDVGKNAGRHPIPQDEINQILLDQAKAGKMVVRLKGGDPFVFGRGGEELELLHENGVDFEVVPGITSSIAAAAYGGIPVTHRDHCSSLHIITGHAKAGAELKIDFESLVKLNGTLVFMMSVSTVEKIADGLIGAGMDPDMPAAVVERGTMPGQRTFTAPLSKICDVVRENEVKSPAVILVGSVCSLSDDFGWFAKRPLLGKRVLVTQPAARSSKLAGGLRELGAEVIMYPCIETKPIRPLDVPEVYAWPLEPDGVVEAFDTIVFTSAEGVRSYCDWLLEEGLDMRALAGISIACIGSATAAALREYGLTADFIPSVYSGEALGKEMVESAFVDKDSRVLLLRTNLASHDVTDALARAYIPFTDYPVYETKLIPQPPLEEIGPVDFVTFTSRSCVEGFVQSQRNSGGDTEGSGAAPRFDGVPALCIGERTAEAAAEYGFDITISDEATIDSMLDKAITMGE